MAFLIGPQIAVHAAKAGFRGADLTTAVAVALASSMGSVDQAGGLWALPGVPGGDPAGNAVKAFERFKAGGWGQWPAYSSGRYLLFMIGAAAAVSTAGVLAIIENPAEAAGKAAAKATEAAKGLPGGEVIDAAQDALGFATKTAAWLGDRQNWIRIAQVVVGGAMIIASVTMIARPEQRLTGLAGMVARPIIKGVVGK